MKDELNSNDEKDYEWVWKALDAYLLANKLKQTKQRKVILEVFMAHPKKHLDAESIHGYLLRADHNIGLATVYRALSLLTEAEILDQNIFSDGRAVFELKTPESHHDHLVCTDCGHIVEFENDEIERLQKEVAESLQFKLMSHKLELFGACLRANCPRKA